MEVCYNNPKVSPLEKDVTVSYPVPVKKCINNPIKLPQVTCEDVEVGRLLVSLSLVRLKIVGLTRVRLS